jgi:type I restriction enzyme S subunit
MMFHVKEMGRGQPQVKLEEVCEFKRGKSLAKKDFVDGKVPVIGGGIKPVGTHNIHNRESYSILISQSGTAGHISRYNEPVWASDCFSLEPKTNIIHDYLYYSVLHLKETIDFLKEGTAQPHVYPTTIQHLEIPLPSLTEQRTLQSDFDEIRHKHAKIAVYKAKAQEAIQRLIPS